eukprot:11459842-Alexandrium_andersonii.AAC.1
MEASAVTWVGARRQVLDGDVLTLLGPHHDGLQRSTWYYGISLRATDTFNALSHTTTHCGPARALQ